MKNFSLKYFSVSYCKSNNVPEELVYDSFEDAMNEGSNLGGADSPNQIIQLHECLPDDSLSVINVDQVEYESTFFKIMQRIGEDQLGPNPGDVYLEHVQYVEIGSFIGEFINVVAHECYFFTQYFMTHPDMVTKGFGCAFGLL